MERESVANEGDVDLTLNPGHDTGNETSNATDSDKLKADHNAGNETSNATDSDELSPEHDAGDDTLNTTDGDGLKADHDTGNETLDATDSNESKSVISDELGPEHDAGNETLNATDGDELKADRDTGNKPKKNANDKASKVHNDNQASVKPARKGTPPARKAPYVPPYLQKRREVAKMSGVRDEAVSGPFVHIAVNIKSESCRLLLLSKMDYWMRCVADTEPLFRYINRHEPSAKLLQDFLDELEKTSRQFVDEHEEALDYFESSQPDVKRRLSFIITSAKHETADFVFQQPYFWKILSLIEAYDEQIYRVEALRVVGCTSEELEQYRLQMVNKIRATVDTFASLTKIRNNRSSNNAPLNVERFERLKQRYYREMDLVAVEEDLKDAVKDSA